ncbi:MAG: efflux RND transporter periplasmic adaptor subunit [Rubrivivax sp.]|jgi:membrane fusion protein (multidrug efflux system)
MNRRLIATTAFVAVAVLGAGAWWLKGRSGAGPAAPVKTAANAAGSMAAGSMAIELAATDIAIATVRPWQRALAINGTIKATDSAVVKAKVAAELQQLLVREGDPVARGQLIGRLDGTEFEWRLKQAREQAEASRAQLEIAERTLANNRALVDQGFISRNALDTAVSNASGARASLAAANAAAEIAGKALRDIEIRAPLAGRVAQRFAQPGERLGIDARIVEIVDLSRLELEAAVAPDDVLALRVGQGAEVRVDGLADAVPAKVARIAPSATGSTRTVAVYLQLAPHAALRHGLFAQASVVVEARQSLVVPVGAVRSDRSRPYVLAVDGAPGSPKAMERPVTLGGRGAAVGTELGATGDPVVEIVTGLSPGTPVLLGTVGSLRDGTRLSLPGATAAATAAAAPAASANGSR